MEKNPKNSISYLKEVLRLPGTQTPGKRMDCLLSSFQVLAHTRLCQPQKLSTSIRKPGAAREADGTKPAIAAFLTCWLSGPCFFQVVECFVIVSKVVEGHTGPVKGLEVFSFLLQDFEAILFDSLIVYQLSLEQAGYRGRQKGRKMLSTQQTLNVSLWFFLPAQKRLIVLGLYAGVYAMGFVIK